MLAPVLPPGGGGMYTGGGVNKHDGPSDRATDCPSPGRPIRLCRGCFNKRSNSLRPGRTVRLSVGPLGSCLRDGRTIQHGVPVVVRCCLEGKITHIISGTKRQCYLRVCHRCSPIISFGRRFYYGPCTWLHGISM